MIDEIISEDLQRIANETRLGALRDKRVLVTGGAGFIGSYLCNVLVEVGAMVTCLDNFSTGLTENINHLEGRKNFKLLKRDISTFKGEERYDHILHFASRASPEDYQIHPIETLLTNSNGSYRMLDLARKHDSKILFASSSEVYGHADVIPTPETYWGSVNPIGIRSCYDEGKRFAEALFMAYHRRHGLDTRIVRLHNTYGPRLRADGVYARALSRFIRQALKDEDITVFGDGGQTRSFCYITDTVRGIVLTLLGNKMKGEVINIGSPLETTILELAKKIREIMDSKSRITFHPSPEDDPERRCPDVSKAKHLLDWAPRIGLDEGLVRTIEWFRQLDSKYTQ